VLLLRCCNAAAAAAAIPADAFVLSPCSRCCLFPAVYGARHQVCWRWLGRKIHAPSSYLFSVPAAVSGTTLFISSLPGRWPLSVSPLHISPSLCYILTAGDIMYKAYATQAFISISSAHSA